MAELTTTFTGADSVDNILFGLVPGLNLPASPIPRGELRYPLAGTVAAPGAGNNQLVSIAVSLPPGHAYVLSACNLVLTPDTGTSNNFTESPIAYWQDDASAPVYQMPIGQASRVSIGAAGVISNIWQLQKTNRPATVMRGSGRNPTFTFLWRNATDDDVAYTLAGTLVVTYYDLEQSLLWPLYVESVTR